MWRGCTSAANLSEPHCIPASLALAAGLAVAPGATAAPAPASVSVARVDPGGVHVYLENKTSREIHVHLYRWGKKEVTGWMSPGHKLDVDGASNGNATR